jgi:hypothetical protein
MGQGCNLEKIFLIKALRILVLSIDQYRRGDTAQKLLICSIFINAI